MNVIFTYKQTEAFGAEVQGQINEVPFSEIPEMKRIEEIIEEEVVSVTVPYQANVQDETEFEYLKAILEEFGIVSVVGKWENDGTKIEFDLNKYRDALKNVETFEDAVFLNGEDFTGREEEFVPDAKLDEDGEAVFDLEGEPVFEQPQKKTFKRLKTSKVPTLAQAKLIEVNVFDNQFKRQTNV